MKPASGDKQSTVNQQVLSDSIRTLHAKFPSFFSELVAFLQREGELICFAKFWSTKLASMRLAPSPQIRNQFGIDLEIPILIAAFEGSQPLEPRALNHLDNSSELRRSSSADKDFAILVAADPIANSYVRERKRFGFPILVLQVKDLEDGVYRNTTLRQEMAKLLQSVDHFDFSNEIRSEMDFFGRLAEIDAVTNLAVAGQNVGLFGLRRAGKTSLLYQVQSRLESKGIKTLYIQLNTITSSEQLIEAFLQRMGELIRSVNGKFDPAAIGSEIFKPNGSLGNVDPALLRRRWVSEFNLLFAHLDLNLVILLDETDLANEEDNGLDENDYVERSEINRILQQLRGIIQVQNERAEKHLSFISAGVASSIYSHSIRFNRENQLFGFASIRPLQPMVRDEMREMVRTLGKRSGLKFEHHIGFDLLLGEYGGHPYLTRIACSRIATQRTLSGESEVPYRVKNEDIEREVNNLSDGSAAHAAWQTLQSFLRWYPEEGELLMQVVNQPSTLANPNRVTHAIGFGLLNEHGGLQMKALGRYAANR